MGRIGRRSFFKAAGVGALAMETVRNLPGQAQPDMELVKSGKASSAIVIPASYREVEQYAAQELQHHIQQSCGVQLDICPELQWKAPSAYRSAIFVGHTQQAVAAGISTAGLPPNGAILRRVGQSLFIIGADSDGPVLGTLRDNTTHVGTLFGVYRFLERRLRVRWLWPGKVGEVIPQQESIVVGPWDERWIPPLLHSRFFDHQWRDDMGWASHESAQGYLHDQSVWLRRQRFARGISLLEDYPDEGSPFWRYWERFHKEHPEYFALLPDDRRAPDLLYEKGDPHYVPMNVSEPGLWKQLVRDWLATRTTDKPWVNCAANDTPGKCIDDGCIAWDAGDSLKVVGGAGNVEGSDIVSVERAKQAFRSNDPQWYRFLGSLSDRYARFYLEVLQEARKFDPDATAIGLAYTNYKQATVRTKLNQNVVIALVPGFHYPWKAGSAREHFREQWLGWKSTGTRLYLRPNFMLQGYSLPLFFADEISRGLAFAYRHGMFATDFDSLTGQWAGQGPNLYAVARVNTNPPSSVKQALPEYYEGFGPAAEPVRRYFEH